MNLAENHLGRTELVDAIAVLHFAQPGGVNKVDAGFGTDLHAHLDAILRSDAKGLLIRSGHGDFCAGADVDLVSQAPDAAHLYRATVAVTAALRRLETAGRPVAVVLDGAALGGGFEVALAAHRRFATPRCRVGLPEVLLGLIPGAGGTQRTARLVGAQAAVELITQGRILPAEPARAAGLVHEVHPDAALAEAAARAWILATPAARQPWDEADFRIPGPQPGTVAFRDLFLGAAAAVTRRTWGAVPAPQHVLSVIQQGAGLSFDRAMELEARTFAALATSPQARDMIGTVWYAKRAAERRIPKLDPGIQRVAVLGAGMMGASLANVLAGRGFDVILKDVSDEALGRALAHVEARNQKRGPEAVARLRARITPTTRDEDVRDVDLVIEAIVEDQGVKHAVTRALAGGVRPTGIWASNTSALPIGELAPAFPDPTRFIGLHFFSPVEDMALVEIIRGPDTSDATLQRALAFVGKLGKTPVVVNDGYGFFTTRVFMRYLLEAVQILAEGHDPVVLEHGARMVGMAVPPLQIFDEVGLALGRHVGDEWERRHGRALPEAAAVLHTMTDVEQRPGKAKGAGFYAYEQGRRAGLWSGLARWRRADVTSDPEALGRRLLLAQAAETARTLDEGLVPDPADADVAAVLGIGFPAATGGPVTWLDRQGLAEVVYELDGLADWLGERFRPAGLLRAQAAAGGRLRGPR